MSNHETGQVVVQPRVSTTPSSSQDRSRRTTPAPPAKANINTSLSITTDENTQMTMPATAGPQYRPHRRRSFHHSDHVRAHAMTTHSTKPITGLTKTGRISKALKGVKVHECDQCGKVYSRAEHLRRHQNNHRSSPLRCRVCDRPFFRDDLLARHVAKYHHPNGLQAVIIDGDSPQRRLSVLSQPSSTRSDSATIHSIKSESETYTHSSHTSTAARYNSVSYSPASSVDSCNISFDSFPPLITNFVATPYPNQVKPPTHEHLSAYSQSNWTETRLPTGEHLFVPSPAGISSPWIPSYPATSTVEDYNYPQEWSGFSSIQSPASNSPGFWDRQLLLDIGDMSNIQASSRSSPAPISAVPPLLMPVSASGLDESNDSHLGLNFSKERKHIYLKAYWQHFHPIFPILHKSRWPYKGLQGGNLLGFAMMAVGAFFTQEVFAATDSRILLERCLDILATSKQAPSTMPLEVLQAIVLLEFLSQFKAKRATEGLSKTFCDVYDMLWNTHTKHHLKSTVDTLSESIRQSEDSLHRQWLAWIDLHSRERLLTACYILDSRHSSLLGRQSHALAAAGFELYMPVSNAIWEVINHQQWAQKLRAYVTPTVTVYEALTQIDQGSSGVYDPFPSALLVACHASASTPSSSGEMSLPYSSPLHPVLSPSRIHLLSHALSPHFSVRIMSLVAQLIPLTPFRALIATSGESWFFSKRLAGDARSAAEEFERLKYEMRSWTSSQNQHSTSYENVSSTSVSSYLQAVSISLQILSEVSTIPNPHLELAFGPELAVYFASLVVWAATFAGLSYCGRRSPVLAEADSDPFEWELPRAAQLMKDFIPVAESDVKQAMLSSHHSSPIQQHTQTAVPTQSMPPASMHALLSPMTMPITPGTAYPQTSMSTSVSPTMAPIPSTAVLPPSPPLVPPPKMLSSWRIGVGAILRWSASILGGAGHRNSGAGELIEGAISVLEKVGRSGWSGQWF